MEQHYLSTEIHSEIVIFDGACGACTAFVGEQKDFFERYGFIVVPLQEKWVQELTGLNEEVLNQSIHVYTSDKKILRGIDFFQYVVSKIWWLAPLSMLLKISFLKPFFEGIYNFIASRRRKISKICGLESRAQYK